MSKTAQVLNHLQRLHSVSSLEVFNLFLVTHVQDMVYKWRKRGMFIASVDMDSTSEAGEHCQYCRYYLPEVMTDAERLNLLALMKKRLGEHYNDKLRPEIEFQIVQLIQHHPHLNGV